MIVSDCAAVASRTTRVARFCLGELGEVEEAGGHSRRSSSGLPRLEVTTVLLAEGCVYFLLLYFFSRIWLSIKHVLNALKPI